jgi:hypothetical protein
LIECSELRFKECREAGHMLGVLPGESELFASLIFNGDVKTWQKAAEQISNGYTFIPKTFTPDEMRSLKTLCDDPNLNAPGSAKKLILACGLRDAFSPTSGRAAVPLLKVMDNVIRSSEGDILAKAFIFQELGRIMRARSADWGLHFCPEVVAQLKNFDAMLGKERIQSGDWNRPASRKKWQARLERFFASIAGGKPFLESGSAFRDTVAIAAAEGLGVTGYVDGAREAHMKSRKDKPAVAWGFGTQDVALVPVEHASGNVSSAGLDKLRLWTPLLRVPSAIRQPGIR